MARTLELSGVSIEKALRDGFKFKNVKCDFIGVVSTPMISFYTKLLKYDFGIMISASHNPYYDNGIKIFKMNGEKLSDEEEIKIEKYFDKITTTPIICQHLLFPIKNLILICIKIFLKKNLNN